MQGLTLLQYIHHTILASSTDIYTPFVFWTKCPQHCQLSQCTVHGTRPCMSHTQSMDPSDQEISPNLHIRHISGRINTDSLQFKIWNGMVLSREFIKFIDILIINHQLNFFSAIRKFFKSPCLLYQAKSHPMNTLFNFLRPPKFVLKDKGYL